MKSVRIIAFFLAATAVVQGFAALPMGRSCINTDWKYARTKSAVWPLQKALHAMEKDGKSFYAPDYDDSKWELISAPHAVNAHDSYDEVITGPGENDFYNGYNFYRKNVALENVAARKFFVEFESVRQNIYVWMNGEMVGWYEAGIAPCGFDLTPYAKDGDNVIAVATAGAAQNASAKIAARETRPGADPTAPKNKKDKPGAGFQWNGTIFNPVQAGLTGNVNLYVKSKTYMTLPLYNNLKTTGIYVWADEFDYAKGAAKIHVDAEVRNESGTDAEVSVKVDVFEPRNTQNTLKASVSSVFSVVRKSKDAGKVFKYAIEDDVYDNDHGAPTRVNTPEVAHVEAVGNASGLVFWSPDTPHLYDVKVDLVAKDGTLLDTQTIRTGFRKIEYGLEKGLTFNGKSFWLRGYAQRATDSWAAIGVAPDWLQDFDAELLRGSNGNFVRWMHVAPKPAPVRAYDKFGVVNVCPAGDAEGESSGRNWRQREEAMRDAMIYFRNSPSVVFYEAGNNQISPEHMRSMRLLKEAVDPHGYRFMGCRTLNTPEQIAEAEYVGTMVHRHDVAAYESMKKVGRFMPMVETEYCREESPRRYVDEFTAPYDYDGKWIGGGAKKPLRDVWNHSQESMSLALAQPADGYTYFYGNRATGNLGKYYSACAMLCWTDCNQHGRNQATENARMSGRVDPVRMPKGNYWTLRAMQAEEPTVKIAGHWNYLPDTPENYVYDAKEYNGDYYAPTGEKARRDPKHKTVYVFGSVHCASVELFVNGKSLGKNEKPENVFVFKFPDVDVTQSGDIEALAYDADGKVISKDRIETVGGPAQLIATSVCGPKGLLADGSDIAFVDVKLVDAKSRVCPLEMDKVTFDLEGPAVFMGGYNSGTAGETSPIGKNWVNLECGVNRVFIRAGREPGLIVLKAKCGKFSAEVAIRQVAAEPFAVPQSLPANVNEFTPKSNAPAFRDLGASGAGAEPWDVYVNGEKVVFEGAVKPSKPDAMTGVVCEFVPVLEAIKKAGAKFTYQYRVKADVPKYLKPFKPPLLTVKTKEHTLEAITGQTQLCRDGKDFILTNYEMISVGWKLIGELSPVLADIPEVKVEENVENRRLDITVTVNKK